MNYKYLSKLKPIIALNQMKMLSFPSFAHSFSVVGHQTFGHFLIRNDSIMSQLTSLNNRFAQDCKVINRPFQKFITSVLRPQTLQAIGNRIDIEDSSKREFNIFEVLAYCLFIEMKQEFKNFEYGAVISDQVYKEKKKKYFDYFQTILNQLRNVEQMRLDQLNKFLPTIKNHVLECQTKFAKKQIYRRLYQMCSYSQKEKEKEPNSYFQNILVKQFIFKINLQYNRLAYILQNKFYSKFENNLNNIFYEKNDKDDWQKSFHPFIVQEMLSLFADQIGKGYYSPLLILQERYRAGRESGEIKLKQNIHYQSGLGEGDLIQTFSFIPTEITRRIHSQMQLILDNAFISALKELGKSSNLLLLTILRGYTNQPKFILFSQFNIKKMFQKNAIHMCIVQSLWNQLTKQEFIDVEIFCKQIIILEKNKVSNQEQYLNVLYSILNLIKGKIRGLILDQFSTFVGNVYKDNFTKIVQSEEQKNFILKIFKKIYHYFSISVICCSSLAYQKQVIQDKLSIMKQTINFVVLDKQFTGSMAHRLLIVWLKLITQNLAILYQLQKETKQKKNMISQQQNQEQKKISQIKNQKIKNIFIKIDSIGLFQNNKQTKQFISGQMSVIKECAKRMVEKLMEDPNTQVTENLIYELMMGEKINYYEKLITNWIQIGSKNSNQFFKRKQIIMILLIGESLNKIKFLWHKTLFPQLPKFLYQQYINEQNQKDIRLKSELVSIQKLLWKALKSKCELQDSELQDLIKYIYKFRDQTVYGSGIGFLVQVYINQIFDSEKDIKNSNLLKKIMDQVYPQKLSKLHLIKKIDFQQVIGKTNTFEKISKQIHWKSQKSKESNSLFMIPLISNFAGCDQYIINFQKRQSENKLKKQAQALHIEIGINKSKEDLQQLRIRVDSKQKAIQNYKNQLLAEEPSLNQKSLKQAMQKFEQKHQNHFSEYEPKMRTALKKNDIDLKSYDILLITGHKAQELNLKLIDQFKIKVLNFKKIPKIQNSKSIKCVHKLLQVYQRIDKEKSNKGKKKQKKNN